ncbi:MAG: 50S ribosomal protein L20 [Candidatus Vogelbacteria bacterium CG22_combo_CG10-13_8_21_14_all_37_9]|uniref:Large ribosomal subunit protein bL20 n=1 Tax=Candidatus Vogelbacteria bacterium CG22_combo_CG10-13_8_21_14_all_37_9 TaxID=1975046 RepID=A0A2H0BKA1_9BACT|nr:MAG: 50S ribosomal protein L20 [Candidatus Vogelbacteria bacterium CG22_combo_CG10-13_8_21_14_all_37_9]
MPRVKRGTISLKRRRNVLKKVKGYRFGRSNKEREAKVAIVKAGVHAFNDRRDKKGNFRRLWQTQISAGSTQSGVSYSKLMGDLKKQNISLNRKVLAEIAQSAPDTFAKLITKAQG